MGNGAGRLTAGVGATVLVAPAAAAVFAVRGEPVGGRLGDAATDAAWVLSVGCRAAAGRAAARRNELRPVGVAARPWVLPLAAVRLLPGIAGPEAVAAGARPNVNAAALLKASAPKAALPTVTAR